MLPTTGVEKWMRFFFKICNFKKEVWLVTLLYEVFTAYASFTLQYCDLHSVCRQPIHFSECPTNRNAGKQVSDPFFQIALHLAAWCGSIMWFRVQKNAAWVPTRERAIKN